MSKAKGRIGRKGNVGTQPTEPVEKKLTIIKSKDDVIRQVTSYHTSYTDALTNSDKPIRYVLGDDGAYKVIINEIGTITAKTKNVPGVAVIDEGFQLKLPKKIPYTMLLQTITFFRDVCLVNNKSEAMVQVYWNRTAQEYFMYCPEQEVSSASVKFKRNLELDRKHLLVMDIHSHNDMGANFSTIDDRDEKEPRIFGVIGKVNNNFPELSFRVGTGTEFVHINIFDVFENPFGDSEYPPEWLDRCQKAVHTQTSFASGKYATGYTPLEKRTAQYYEDMYEQGEFGSSRYRYDEKTGKWVDRYEYFTQEEEDALLEYLAKITAKGVKKGE